MAAVTLQIVEGLERGTTFRGLDTPVTIGREEENSLRLNDERVSRFHVKLQEDAGNILLTDLDSTNGTRVNGRPVSMRVLRPGDQIAVGRCLLTFGDPEEVAAARPAPAREPGRTPAPGGGADGFALSDSTGSDSDGPPFLPPGERPAVPAGLDPLQTAQLCDLLGHLHAGMLAALDAGRDPRRDDGGPDHGGPGDGAPAGGGTAAPADETADPGGRFVPAAAWGRLAGAGMTAAELLRDLREPPG